MTATRSDWQYHGMYRVPGGQYHTGGRHGGKPGVYPPSAYQPYTSYFNELPLSPQPGDVMSPLDAIEHMYNNWWRAQRMYEGRSLDDFNSDIPVPDPEDPEGRFWGFPREPLLMYPRYANAHFANFKRDVERVVRGYEEIKQRKNHWSKKLCNKGHEDFVWPRQSSINQFPFDRCESIQQVYEQLEIWSLQYTCFTFK